MRVVPFGVASGRPTTTTNVSGMAVDLGPRWLLVDCGEGTQQQVMRSVLKLSRLDGVLITHLHGDHVLGLPGLLGTLGMEGRSRPLPVVGPAGLRGWLDAMAATPILTLDYPIEITELAESGGTGSEPGAAGSPRDLGEMAGCHIETLPLRHRVPSFGYRITEAERPGRVDAARAAELGVVEPSDLGRLQRGETVAGAHGPVTSREVVGPPRRGRVVTVLGDTTPCEASVQLASQADLLVHEATYGDESATLGEQWRHSTARQAAEVAKRAGARRLLITHFSSRYDGTEDLLAQARSVFPATSASQELEPIEVPATDDVSEPGA